MRGISVTVRRSARATNSRLRELLVNLALVVVSTAVALGIGEGVLRLLGHGPMYVSPERDRFWAYDPQLGWAHRPGQEAVFATRQFRTTVHINQRGLRDGEHPYARLPDSRRILVLGDSFAWGYGVEEPERFSERLEASLGVEVINAGVSGYSTDQELLWLRSEGIKYDFDLVVLVMAGNDIGDNQKQLVSHIYYKPEFVVDGGQLNLIGYPIPRTSPQGRMMYSLSQHSSMAYFAFQRYFDLAAMVSTTQANRNDAIAAAAGPSPAPEPFQLTMALLNEIDRTAESKDARFMIVATDRWWNGPAGSTYQDFIGTAQAAGHLVLDVEGAPGFDPDNMVIPADGHWNQAGHAFVADRIADLIQSHQLLPQP